MSMIDRSAEAHRLADQLVAIGRECAPRLKEPYRSAEHSDLLYDERGLPSKHTVIVVRVLRSEVVAAPDAERPSTDPRG